MYQREKVVQGRFDEKKVLIYDIEVYPNFFSCAYYIVSSDTKGVIEISPRKNEIGKLYKLLENLRDKGWSMVGYNNSEYDWLILNWVWENQQYLQNLAGGEISAAIYEFNDYYFTHLSKVYGAYFNYKKENNFWVNNYKINQIDLMAIHRLNAMGSRVSLKNIQFNIKSPNITTLPYKPGTILKPHEMDDTISYNVDNDVVGTNDFYLKSLSEINFRKFMGEELGKNFYSSDDVKIATVYARDYFESNNIDLYYKNEDGERKVIQTTYPNGVSLKSVFFDCVNLKSEAFNAVIKWVQSQHVYETKGVFTDLPLDTVKTILPYTNPTNIKAEKIEKLSVQFGGLDFNFGMGGIHASLDDAYIASDDDYVLLDVDALSYYPMLIWLFKIFPDHIGEIFCQFAKDTIDKRRATPKSNPWNKTYKLILNSFLFGKLWDMMGNSFVLDIEKALIITLNGQLLLCMLSEMVLDATNDTSLIQANTDGVTFKVRRSEVETFRGVIKEFENVTGHIMEEVQYDWMAINNVNNYMAKFSDIEANGKDRNTLKVKGVYVSDGLAWTKDFGTLVVQKSVLEYFKSGTLPEQFIPEHKDPYDFRGRVKVDRRFDLYIFNDANREDVSFKKVGVSDCVNFQRIINNNDVPAILKELNNDEDFIHYIRTDISESKKIDYDDVPMKSVNSRLKSIPSRAKFLGEVFAGRVQVHDRIGKAFARWWLDRDKKLTMKPMKGKKLQTVTAYYMAKKGFYMFKETLPTEEQPLRGKFTGVQAGQKVVPCNNIADFKFDNVDFDWYINEAWKLITPIMPEKDKHISPIYQADLEKVRLAEEKIRLAIEKKRLAAEKKALAAKKKLDKTSGK